jgi:hypothetical protein
MTSATDHARETMTRMNDLILAMRYEPDARRREAIMDEFDALDEQLTGALPDFNEAAQPDMFAARVDDLPLFSGTAKRQTSRPFVPEQAARQANLFED